MTKLTRKQKELQIKHRNSKGQVRGGGPPTLEKLSSQLATDNYRSIASQAPTSNLGAQLLGVKSDDRSLIQRYEDRFAGSNELRPDGKVVRWDSRTNKEYDPAEALKYINYWKYGTETPVKDVNYLKAKANMERTIEKGPHPLRIWGSKKNRKGGKIVEAQHQNYWSNEGKGGQNVNKLKIRSSFAIDDRYGD